MFESILQPRHLIVILLVAVIFFGPSKLPELGKSLAKGIKEFKDTFSGDAANGPEKK